MLGKMTESTHPPTHTHTPPNTHKIMGTSAGPGSCGGRKGFWTR